MAANSPESPSKKRKQSINGLKREQPLFAGRRPNRSLQQPPEFLTDSLNASYIPSPSPPKSPTRRDVRAKPRQALSNGRSLPAALKATSPINDENRPPFSTSSFHHKSAQHPLKPRPASGTARGKTKSPSKAARSPALNRTPSPTRGRQSSITSPANSESSPGRGYAEAYQRIVEEENLAQEDSIDNMEEFGGHGFNQQDRLQDLDRLRLQRLHQSTSPMSLKASRRASPRGALEVPAAAEDGIDDKENGHESDSDSGVDYTENVTDTSMDSGSSQYAKDLQRLGALKSGAKAFSKARVGERVGLSVENLQRRNGSSESLGSSFSAGSLSNRGSDPSINIPKAWGRKAKPGKDWLARINSRSGRFTGDVQKRHSSGDQIIVETERREWSEPIDQWIATAADVPLPSSEDGPSQVRETSQGSTPTTTVPRSASLDRRRQWEMNDDDFTGRSLQISESPPIRIRSSALDLIREREIQSLEKRAVTTSRLGELREKSSGESLRRTQSNKTAEEPHKDEETAPPDVSPRKGSPRKSESQIESQEADQNAAPEDSLQDEGEPIPDTPVVIYRNNSHDVAVVDQKSGKKSGDECEIQRPSHERKDSHDILKRLARVTSESPSPTRQHAVPVQQSSQRNTEAPLEQMPHTKKSTSNLKTPVVSGAWVDQTLDKTPQPSMPNVSLKTPLITGAWIDTPLPTGGRGPPMPTPSDPEEQKELTTGKIGAADLIHRLSPNNISSRPRLQAQAPLEYSGPSLAKSALEEVLNEAKSAKGGKHSKASRDSDSEEEPTLHLGESTIQSLEEFIASDEDYSTLLAPTPPSPEIAQPFSDPSPASQALTTNAISSRSSGLADLQSYTHLLSRLTNLAPSLRASKKQIETIERAVSTVPTDRPRSLLKRDPEECHEAGELHDFLFPCGICGCPGRMDQDRKALFKLRDSITTITLPIPRLWHWERDDWRPRLTWLGSFTFLGYGLYLAESYAQFKYCHPLYARTMVGYGVDVNAPRPPFVLAKVIYRHTAIGTLLAPFYHITRIVLKLFASLVGYLVGFMFGDEGAGNKVKGGRQPASRDARIPRPTWGPDLSLMDDEYL